MAVNPRHTPRPASTGMVARHGPESWPGMLRNWWPAWSGIPTRGGERAAEAAAGGLEARERSHERGLTKKMVAAPARRELVRWMGTRGLSERRCLAVVGMSASSFRYQPRPDQNVAQRARIVALAQRHRRYGSPMIYLKLRQGGEVINHKRVERLYALEKLHIRRRRRKKIPVADRQPLIRPESANEVSSMDLVFDRVAGGRMLKCLVIVDDATHESVAIVVEHTIGGDHLTRLAEQ